MKAEGAWPLGSLRQSFLNGSLTRLIDPDATLKTKLVEFVIRGDFGLASSRKPDGTFERLWFNESVTGDEVAFEPNVFLLRRVTAEALKTGTPPATPSPTPGPVPAAPGPEVPVPEPVAGPASSAGTRTVRLTGAVPPETWNRLGTRILPKLRAGTDLKIDVDFSVTVSAELAPGLEGELRQLLDELGLRDALTVE